MFKGTTICAVSRNGITAIAGDGQVTLGETVMKPNAVKLRRLYGGKVVWRIFWRFDEGGGGACKRMENG